MGFVDDDRVVSRKLRVGLDFGEQDAVGHELDEGAGGDLLCEAHLVADLRAEVDAELVGEPVRHRACGDAPGLRVADHGGRSAAQLQAYLRQLGGFSRPGLSCDDDDLVVADRPRDLVSAGGNRQIGVGDARHGPLARLDLLGGERRWLLAAAVALATGSLIRALSSGGSGAFEASRFPAGTGGIRVGTGA